MALKMRNILTYIILKMIDSYGIESNKYGAKNDRLVDLTQKMIDWKIWPWKR